MKAIEQYIENFILRHGVWAVLAMWFLFLAILLWMTSL